MNPNLVKAALAKIISINHLKYLDEYSSESDADAQHEFSAEVRTMVNTAPQRLTTPTAGILMKMAWILMKGKMRKLAQKGSMKAHDQRYVCFPSALERSSCIAWL